MSEWTEERVEQLKKLWLQGWSASQIAKELGNTTRNAVIGKIHRLNLVARQSPKMTPPGALSGASAAKAKSPLASSINIRTPQSPRSEYQPPAVAFANLAKDRTSVSGSLSGSLASERAASPAHNPFAASTSFGMPSSNRSSLGLGLSAGSARQCQWPVGDPRSAGFHFCGCQPAESLPYCAEHAKLAYQSSNKSRRVNVGNGDLHASGTPDEREIMVRV